MANIVEIKKHNPPDLVASALIGILLRHPCGTTVKFSGVVDGRRTPVRMIRNQHGNAMYACELEYGEDYCDGHTWYRNQYPRELHEVIVGLLVAGNYEHEIALDNLPATGLLRG